MTWGLEDMIEFGLYFQEMEIQESVLSNMGNMIFGLGRSTQVTAWRRGRRPAVASVSNSWEGRGDVHRSREKMPTGSPQ